MHRETAHRSRRSRSLVVLLLALAIVAVFGIAAQQALASPSFVHGGAACASCHNGSPAAGNVTNARCITCHTGYAALNATKTCWTCHTPGQAMASVKTGAPASCIAVCHLANATDNTHNPHPVRGVCTTCHPLTVSATNANGSWHHKAQAPPVKITTTIKLTVAPKSIKLKKTVKATGTVTPVDLGGKASLTAQRKSGSKWVKAKTANAIVKATGKYSWTYKPTKKGSYRIQASIKATATKKASHSPWKTFKVK